MNLLSLFSKTFQETSQVKRRTIKINKNLLRTNCHDTQADLAVQLLNHIKNSQKKTKTRIIIITFSSIIL